MHSLFSSSTSPSPPSSRPPSPSPSEIPERGSPVPADFEADVGIPELCCLPNRPINDSDRPLNPDPSTRGIFRKNNIRVMHELGQIPGKGGIPRGIEGDLSPDGETLKLEVLNGLDMSYRSPLVDWNQVHNSSTITNVVLDMEDHYWYAYYRSGTDDTMGIYCFNLEYGSAASALIQGIIDADWSAFKEITIRLPEIGETVCEVAQAYASDNHAEKGLVVKLEDKL